MNSRARLTFVALLVLPLLAFGLALFQDYGTAEDFQRLNIGGEDDGAILSQAHRGIIQSALLETSFLHATSVADLPWIRLLAVFLAGLTGLALWQILERGGWAEWDAAAAGICVSLLPSVQVIVGWATAWPVLLATLLSLAGFAAVESELERGGLKRFVGMLGGVMLYACASLVNFPSALFGVVPLAGLLLVRPRRLWAEHRKWLLLHVLILVVGVLAGWAFERRLLDDVGLLASMQGVDYVSRVQGFLTRGLALGLAGALPYWLVSEHLGLAWLATLATAALVVLAARREARDNDVAGEKWTRAFLVPLGLIFVSLFFAPEWRAGYRAVLPLGGLAVVAFLGALRVLVAPGKKLMPFYLGGLGLLVLGCVALAYQRTTTQIADPLAAEWRQVHGTVMRATFPTQSTIFVIAPPESAPQLAGFHPTALGQTASVERMVRAALSERYGDQIKKRTFTIRSGARPEAGAKYDLVVDPVALKR